GPRAEPDPPAPSDAPEPTDDEAAPGDGPAPAAPPRRSLDDAVMAVLREEAEREAAARRAEAARGIETQRARGRPAAVPVPAAAATLAASAAHSGGAGPADDDDHPISQRHGAARRDLLPDIEEINSSLRAGAEPREASEPDGGQPAGTDRGFRSGFVAILVIAAVLVALYVMAPRIATLIPGSAGTMEAYVTTVDGLRTGLDSLLQRATALLRGATGG
ncbi:MAG TPA: hypothetical protein PKC84_18410, partial [Paracoccaceae bacterium]|nr:hypothetical protein [Paracoccaceae bacterium]